MKKTFLILFFIMGTVIPSDHETENTFDFEFRDMELQKAVESVAKLMNRYVIFSPKLTNKAITVSLSNVTPLFAMKLLLENNGAYFTEKEGIYYVSSLEERQLASVALTPTIIPLVNVIAADIEPNVKGYLPSGVTYTINEQQNAFIINGKDEDIKKLRQLISELDQEVTQIFIEAKIIESNVTFSRNLGIEWGAENVRNGSGLAIPPGINSSGLIASGNTDHFIARIRTGLSASSSLDALLIAGEKNGDLKVISSPKITTLNGTPASIDTSATLTFLVPSNVSVPGATSTTTSTLLPTQTSALRFRVTPFVVSDDQVRLIIELTKTDPIATTKDAATNTVTNTLNTGLMVRNGQTASLGGMFSKRSQHEESGVPFLAKLPILGLLFGSDHQATDDRELMIFMTPTIYKSSQGTSAKNRSTLSAPNLQESSERASLENLR